MTLIITLLGAVGALGTFLIVALDRLDKTRLAISLHPGRTDGETGYVYITAKIHPRTIHTTVASVKIENGKVTPVIYGAQDQWSGNHEYLPDIHKASSCLSIDKELLPAGVAASPLNVEFFVRANSNSSDKVRISFLTTERWALRRHTCHARINKSQA